MLVLITVAAFVWLGRELSMRWWSEEVGPFERACYAATIGIAGWVGSLWILAILHLVTMPVLLARTAFVIAVALRFGWTRSAPQTRDAVVWIAAIPFVLWLSFILYRGAILPPVSHDALAYHLPKAVLYARAGGYDALNGLDPRIRRIPANYELLLTDAIVTDRTDRWTEWLSALFYLLFALAAAALAERWWRSRRAPILAALLTGGVPVALLHSGAHKNDLMTGFFIVAALVLCGRWIDRREPASLTVAIVAFAVAMGTKPQAAAVAACVAPFVVWKMARRDMVRYALVAIVAFLLLGGAVYGYNLASERSVIGVGKVDDASTVIGWGDWANLWQAPYVLLAAPFARNPRELPVPWEDRPWFWRRYEVFFSHLGIPFSIAAVAAVGMMIRYRGRERLLITLSALGGFLLLLPVVFLPHGMFAISLPRYALFVVPVIFAWLVGPLERFAVPLAVAGAFSFAWYAIDNARNDTFAPFAYIQFLHEHPGNRSIPFDAYRAASVADRYAGPRDTIAIDPAFGTWIYPAFGAGLTRPVEFITAADGEPLISDAAKWVVVDRGFSSIWENPQFRDLSQARQFLVRGKPTSDELRVFRSVRANPRFELVFYNQLTNQAVFRRIH